MNANRPRGIRQVTPRRTSSIRSPLRNDLWTSETSIIGGPRKRPGGRASVECRASGFDPSTDQCDPSRIASIGTSLDAFQAG